MKLSPKSMKRFLNLYPPYLGAGIKITYLSQDWRELHVAMSVRWYNRNAVNTHFGGSLYSMVDPHLMLLLMQLLGKDYFIWDRAADIEFLKATKKKVTCEISITDKDLEEIKQGTQGGDKYFPTFTLEIKDELGNVIAKVNKTLYVKRKPLKL
ncbi:DUF4442 domain-containing protein [Shewanella violacea]|uniref:DUF4442 domain-containing protein n=1 Tax=Shewanella violacea (strain JCM 10179 / CIP 106290 / LMG 19151 / DSS12) TaxID=637905 RepID=D4ZJS2_SHEVD|nr:DUF4442 domain-containing protein [Shewanella violacea]BAJ01921.1 conserved hypothetical protein [Shewanella violacea DSS12]